MPHKGEYSKPQEKKLKKLGVKPGTKKAHLSLKKRKMSSDTGSVYS